MTGTRSSMPVCLLVISTYVALSIADSAAQTGKYEHQGFTDLPVLFPPVGEQTLSVSQRTVIRRQPSNSLTNDQLLPVIRGFHVNTTIYYRFAQTKVCQIIYNPSNHSKEFTFNYPVPKEAYVSGFTIGDEDGRTEKATFGIYRPNAYDEYNEESFRKEIGKSIIVSVNARHSLLFSLPVDVPAHKELNLCVSYEEILNRKTGNYQYPVHISTNTVVGIDLQVRVHIKEGDPLRNLNVTAFVTENEQYSSVSEAALSFEDLAVCRSNISYININCISSSEVVITFRPSEDDQINFITYYARSKRNEQKESLPGLEGTYNLSSSLSTFGLNGKFNIMYNVKRPDDGGGVILYNEKHFAHFFEPPPVDRVNIHLIIVIDGYFNEKYENQSILVNEALRFVIMSLDDGDYFNVIKILGPSAWLFGGAHLYGTSISKSNEESDSAGTDADGSMESTANNIRKILDHISNVTASQADKLARFAHFLHSFADSPETNTEMGLRGALRCALTCGKENIQSDMTKPLPVILYLPRSDNHGVGQADFSEIASMITTENFQSPQAQLFALKVDRNIDPNVEEGLWNITAANGGWLGKLYDSNNIKEQVLAFYKAIKSPLGLNISLTYRNGVKSAPILTQSKFSAIYSGTETLITGEFPDGVHETEFEATAAGTFKKNGLYVNSTFRVAKVVDYRTIEDAVEEDRESVIDRIWAHSRIKDLLTKSATAYLKNKSSHGTENKDDSSWQKYEIEGRELSLRYNLLTPFTTLILKQLDTHVMRLAPIVPYDLGEQFLHTEFREEIMKTYEAISKWFNRINNVTWLNNVFWNPSLDSVSVRDSLNKTYTMLWPAWDMDDLQDCSTRTTPPKEGTCEHFVNCILPEVENDLEMFKKYQCQIRESNYLAICCPKRDQTSSDFQIAKEFREQMHIYNALVKKYFVKHIPEEPTYFESYDDPLLKRMNYLIKRRRIFK